MESLVSSYFLTTMGSPRRHDHSWSWWYQREEKQSNDSERPTFILSTIRLPRNIFGNWDSELAVTFDRSKEIGTYGGNGKFEHELMITPVIHLCIDISQLSGNHDTHRIIFQPALQLYSMNCGVGRLKPTFPRSRFPALLVICQGFFYHNDHFLAKLSLLSTFCHMALECHLLIPVLFHANCTLYNFRS